MNPRGLPDEVGVERADHDPGVVRLFVVQTDEMPAIERQDGTPKADGECQHIFVADGLIRPAGFQNGENIVTESSQFFDDRPWKVFIGVQHGHDHASSLSRI